MLRLRVKLTPGINTTPRNIPVKMFKVRALMRSITGDHDHMSEQHAQYSVLQNSQIDRYVISKIQNGMVRQRGNRKTNNKTYKTDQTNKG